MIMSYFKKGKQLAKSDLQHQPCPAITLPLTLHTVANESYGSKRVFCRFQSPNDSLNTEKAIWHQKIEGGEVKLQKQTIRGGAQLGSTWLHLLLWGDITALLESGWLSPVLAANSHFLCDSVCTSFFWSFYLLRSSFIFNWNSEFERSLRCGPRCGIGFKWHGLLGNICG